MRKVCSTTALMPCSARYSKKFIFRTIQQENGSRLESKWNTQCSKSIEAVQRKTENGRRRVLPSCRCHRQLESLSLCWIYAIRLGAALVSCSIWLVLLFRSRRSGDISDLFDFLDDGDDDGDDAKEPTV